MDIASTRPGTPGGRFMRQFWLAVHRSEDVAAGHAKPLRIMSEDYTLYRGESGRAQVSRDSLDNLGDALTYGLSLYAVGRSEHAKGMVSMFKGRR